MTFDSGIGPQYQNYESYEVPRAWEKFSGKKKIFKKNPQNHRSSTDLYTKM